MNRLDGAAVVAHLKVLPGEAGDAPALPVGDVDGDDDQVGPDADDLLFIVGGCRRYLRRDVRLTEEKLESEGE